MPNYLILYRSTTAPGEQMAASTPEEMEAGMAAWYAWGAAASDHLVDFGSPTMPTSEAEPGPAGWIGGYSIMRAADLSELDTVLAAHPHKEYGTIEVLEIHPLPGS